MSYCYGDETCHICHINEPVTNDGVCSKCAEENPIKQTTKEDAVRLNGRLTAPQREPDCYLFVCDRCGHDVETGECTPEKPPECFECESIMRAVKKVWYERC